MGAVDGACYFVTARSLQNRQERRNGKIPHLVAQSLCDKSSKPATGFRNPHDELGSLFGAGLQQPSPIESAI